MPLVVNPPELTELETVTLYGDEFSFDGNPLYNVPVGLRQLQGGVDVVQPANVGGPSLRIYTDTNGHWAVTIVPGDDLVPPGLLEIWSPTLGFYRAKAPVSPGLYKATTLRDNTI